MSDTILELVEEFRGYDTTSPIVMVPKDFADRVRGWAVREGMPQPAKLIFQGKRLLPVERMA